MKRFAGVVFVMSVAVLGLTAGTASGQTDDSTTTTAPDTTSTTVPEATTTTVANDASTTTTTAPDTTSTIPAVMLPGEHVTAGSLTVGANFATQTGSDCTASGSVAGGEVNVIRDQNGKIGAVYGTSTLGGTQAGLVMVGLGPLPLAIGAFRTEGTCNQDVVGIGTYSSSATSASFGSVGFGMFPQDFASKVTVNLTASATVPTASLDLQSAYAFLATPRGAEAPAAN